MLRKSLITCYNFYFHSYNSWKYYYKDSQKRPTSDFYKLYCQPPFKKVRSKLLLFPNHENHIYLHCRRCLVYFLHTAWTDQEGKQNNEAIYIDKNGLCLECRQQEEHLDHACLFSKTNRVWGTKNSWEGLFESGGLPVITFPKKSKS